MTLALTGGQRGRRGFEIAAGVTVGVGIAEGLVHVVGSGTVQLGFVVFAAMVVAVLLGGSVLAVTQSGVSAAFVVALEQPADFAFARTAHAAIGALCALFVSFVILPLNPLRLIRNAAHPVLGELAGTLRDIAAALDAGALDGARAALGRARAAEPLAADFSSALMTGRETAIAALPRRRALRVVDVYVNAGAHLDLAVRNVRVIARSALRALEIGDSVPPDATGALRELARAVDAVEAWLQDAESVAAVHEHALRAARGATDVLETTANLSVSVIVGAVRSAAVDLLRSTGMDRDEAVRRVREPST